MCFCRPPVVSAVFLVLLPPCPAVSGKGVADAEQKLRKAGRNTCSQVAWLSRYFRSYRTAYHAEASGPGLNTASRDVFLAFSLRGRLIWCRQDCVHHKAPPIFHETAKWWSCCPDRKAGGPTPGLLPVCVHPLLGNLESLNLDIRWAGSQGFVILHVHVLYAQVDVRSVGQVMCRA